MCGSVANVSDLKDRILKHVQNITPDALHSSNEHIKDCLNCVLQLKGHVKSGVNLIGTAMSKRNHIICINFQ